MLPLVHNTIHHNRNNTVPSSSSSPVRLTHSNNSSAATNAESTNNRANEANSSYANSTNISQYGEQINSKENSSDCKKLKSGKVCITSNGRPFLKKRSLTFSSIFSSSSSSTNSLHLVEETLASVLRPNLSELLSGSSKTFSELNLTTNQQRQKNEYLDQNKTLPSLCKTSSTSSSTLTDESGALDNLADLSNDLNSFNNNLTNSEKQNNQSTNDLNSELNSDSNNRLSITINQTTPSFPPPSYTPIDPNKKMRPFLRSQSAPHQFYLSTRSTSSEAFSNLNILENIQENIDPVIVKEDEEQTDMQTTRRNSYLNHQFNICLAHENNFVKIPGFNTFEELYQRISNVFNINLDQILYCTLNTNKFNIDSLFEKQISLNDEIFVHIKGISKEIEIKKTDILLGLTICDNKKGLCLIKKIKEGSVIDKIKFIQVGDVIEKINDVNLYGNRHIDVANMLKMLPVGELFVIKLIEPRSNTADELSTPQLGRQLRNRIKKGCETLRIRLKGAPIFEEEDESNDEIIEKMNSIIEDFFGISDSHLTQQLLDISKECSNPNMFLKAINNSDLSMFRFDVDFVFDIWEVIESKTNQIKSSR